jgi:hypothetical protein
MRRFRSSKSGPKVDRWLRLHPRTTLAIGIAALGAITIWEIVRVAAARHTVASGWAAGLGGGLAASLAMTTVLIITYKLIQGTPRKIGGPLWLLTLLIGVSPSFAFVFTAPQPGPQSETPYVVTTGGAVAAMAYAAAFFTFYLALAVRAIPRVVRSPRPTVADTHRELLTALVGRGESRWDVSWIGGSRSPRRLSAASLTDATDQAAAAAVQHCLRRPARAADTDFQIAVFPHDYAKGPIFEISGGPRAFTAIDKASGRELHGATLEELLQAADSAGDLRAGDYMFHWLRPVTDLPFGTAGPKNPAYE